MSSRLHERPQGSPRTWLNMERILFSRPLLPFLKKPTSSPWMSTRYVHLCGCGDVRGRSKCSRNLCNAQPSRRFVCQDRCTTNTLLNRALHIFHSHTHTKRTHQQHTHIHPHMHTHTCTHNTHTHTHTRTRSIVRVYIRSKTTHMHSKGPYVQSNRALRISLLRYTYNNTHTSTHNTPIRNAHTHRRCMHGALNTHRPSGAR